MSLGILVHHYFISLKGNIWKFERYIGLLTSYIISINYISYIDEMLFFGPSWAQNTIVPKLKPLFLNSSSMIMNYNQLMIFHLTKNTIVFVI